METKRDIFSVVNSIKFDNRFRSAEFILKITVPKVAEKVAEKLTEKLTENGNVTENY